jgi:hypothetical protein
VLQALAVSCWFVGSDYTCYFDTSFSYVGVRWWTSVLQAGKGKYSRTSIIRASINREFDRAILLRAVIEEDGDLREFCKKWTLKDAIFSCSDCWSDIPSVTLRKSWRKLHPDVMVDDLNGNEPEPQKDVRTAKGKNS